MDRERLNKDIQRINLIERSDQPLYVTDFNSDEGPFFDQRRPRQMTDMDQRDRQKLADINERKLTEIKG